jgi:hypothetical protein
LSRTGAEPPESVEDNLGVRRSELLPGESVPQLVPENGSEQDGRHEKKLADAFRASLLKIVHSQQDAEEPEEGLNLNRKSEEFELEHAGRYALNGKREKKNGRPDSRVRPFPGESVIGTDRKLR